jgi:hypothetical protein
LRTFVFFTPIAAVALVLVRQIWEAASTGAEINPWVLALGSVLGWVSVQLTLLKFVDALGFENMAVNEGRRSRFGASKHGAWRSPALGFLRSGARYQARQAGASPQLLIRCPGLPLKRHENDDRYSVRASAAANKLGVWTAHPQKHASARE